MPDALSSGNSQGRKKSSHDRFFNNELRSLEEAGDRLKKHHHPNLRSEDPSAGMVREKWLPRNQVLVLKFRIIR